MTASPAELAPPMSSTGRLLRPGGERPGARPGQLPDQLAEYGPLPRLTADRLVGLLAESGLTGRGGAGFPTWRKLQAVAAAGGRPVVVANGAEGEPASAKDGWLLANRPHLVLNGLALVAAAVGAAASYLYVDPRRRGAGLVRALSELAGQRHRAGVDPIAVRVAVAPPEFLAGEASAVVNHLGGRAAVPRDKPPHVSDKGLGGQPTLVQNVETLAHLALIARYGPAWFRRLGTHDEPGTLLLTVGGGVRHPGVLEMPYGSPLPAVIDAAGGLTGPAQAVLLGGYHGGWISAHEAAGAVLSRPALAALGSALGAGVVVALPATSCGLAETARVVGYLAAQSAGQCGPCLNGLPRLAELLRALAVGEARPRVVAELRRVAGLVDGRGACHHPDGTVRFLGTALRVFAPEVDLHLAGRCTATRATAVLPIPALDGEGGA